MRPITELVDRRIALPGSGDSAAAMVATSAPVIEKITTRIAAKMAPTPLGKNPPWAVRLLRSKPLSGHAPTTNRTPMTRNSTMAATLIPANQNSNSPKELTEKRFVAVLSDISTRDASHSGIPGAQNWTTLAPAPASKPMTITQKYQYSHPTEKPAQPPSAERA